MTPRDRLRALAALALLVERRALVPVAKAQAAVAAAASEVAEVQRHRQSMTVDVLDPALAAGMSRHAERLRRKQAEVLSGLAGKKADLEIALHHARPAIGRRIVIQRLVARQDRKR